MIKREIYHIFFKAEIGGMIGIMMGASIISLLELIYFYLDLIVFGFDFLRRKLSNKTSDVPPATYVPSQ